MSVTAPITASCLCGAVGLTITGPLRPPMACHCTQCRKTSGHFSAASGTPRSGLSIAGPLRWFRSSPGAQRGFCATCGSNLLWQADGADEAFVAVGSIDGATGLELAGHIYTNDKGDYYGLDDDLPTWPRGDT